MRNQPLFLQAIDNCPDVVTKLHALTAKIASLRQIYTRAPTVDPLDNPDLGPARAGASEQHGRHIGQLAGGLAGAALGGLAGHEINNGSIIGGLSTGLGEAANTAVHLPFGHMDAPGPVHDVIQGATHNIGTAAGAAAGGLAGRAIGGGLGAGLGRMSASRESEAAERIKKMDPATGLAHIRMTEQLGHESPSVLQAMKDAYETRRRGLGTQIQSGVPVPPGTTVQNLNQRPQAAPF